MSDFRIVDKLQKIDEDIQRHQLKYHTKRVLVSKEFTFDAAHHLHDYEGKCKNLHGHTYRAVLGLSGYTDERGLMAVIIPVLGVIHHLRGMAVESI